MLINLENKNIVVTGSSKGIGAALVKQFTQEKANVVINYFKSEENAISLFNEVRKMNYNCILVKADVTNASEVKTLYQRSIDEFGKIDILVNNAGICDDNLLSMMTEAQWDNVIDINLKGLFLCSRIFSRHMIKNKSGKIINIASLRGLTGNRGQTNYSASKAGVIGFTKALAKELGEFNISVNAVCPGFIVSDMNKENKLKSLYAQKQTVFKVYNYMDCLIQFLTFMVSDNFHSVTGQVFNIDSRLL